MWPVCWHYGGLATFQFDTMAINSYHPFTVYNVYQGIKRCRMFAQALTLVKSEEGYRASITLDYCPADH
jgi:hypothetical protein